LVDSSSMVSSDKLRQLSSFLKSQLSSKTEIVTSTQIEDIRAADIVIIATNSPFSIISSEHLKLGAIVIDDSFPKNISRELVAARKDVIFLEGGAINFSDDFDILASQRLPSLAEAPLEKLLSHKYGYSSFSETIILAFWQQRKNYTLGSGNTDLISDIQQKAKVLGVIPKILKCYGEEINIEG